MMMHRLLILQMTEISVQIVGETEEVDEAVMVATVKTEVAEAMTEAIVRTLTKTEVAVEDEEDTKLMLPKLLTVIIS